MRRLDSYEAVKKGRCVPSPLSHAVHVKNPAQIEESQLTVSAALMRKGCASEPTVMREMRFRNRSTEGVDPPAQ
jgi:hypothetical protein